MTLPLDFHIVKTEKGDQVIDTTDIKSSMVTLATELKLAFCLDTTIDFCNNCNNCNRIDEILKKALGEKLTWKN